MNFCGLFLFSLVPIFVNYILKQLKSDCFEGVGFGIHPALPQVHSSRLLHSSSFLEQET